MKPDAIARRQRAFGGIAARSPWPSSCFIRRVLAEPQRRGLRVRYATVADLIDQFYRGLADNTVGKRTASPIDSSYTIN